MNVIISVSLVWASLTSRSFTSSLTLAAVSVDCFPLDASFMSVARKFLHFFTFSIVSCQEHTTSRNGSQNQFNTCVLYKPSCKSSLQKHMQTSKPSWCYGLNPTNLAHCYWGNCGPSCLSGGSGNCSGKCALGTDITSSQNVIFELYFKQACGL